MKRITVVGMGPGHQDYLLPIALRAIESAHILIGSKRHLEPFQNRDKTYLVWDQQFQQVYEFLEAFQSSSNENAEYLECPEYLEYPEVAVLVSGDTGFHSFMTTLQKKFPNLNIEAIPGISTISYFASKLCVSYDESELLSLHGVDHKKVEDLLPKLKAGRPIFLLMDHVNTPAVLAQFLVTHGFGDLKMAVGQQLSYSAEKIEVKPVHHWQNQLCDALCVVWLEGKRTLQHGDRPTLQVQKFHHFGLPDEVFIRGDVPMTKSEVRTLSLSKLMLQADSQILDIGCGTGSVTVECASACPNGHVYALDQKSEGVSLTQANVEHFQLSNVTVQLGQAPEHLPDQQFDRIFLGGGSQAIPEIVTYARGHLSEDGVFVANTILLDSTLQIIEQLKLQGFKQIECHQVQITKIDVHLRNMMRAHNPIFIIRGIIENQKQ